jgi:hypothetical protein
MFGDVSAEAGDAALGSVANGKPVHTMMMVVLVLLFLLPVKSRDHPEA